MKIFAPRISLKEKMFFVEHLAVMLKAAIPLDRALASLGEQAESKKFRRILDSLLQSVRRGESISKGLSQFQGVFGAFFINMIQAGEYSGKLEEGLRRLYRQMKKDYELKARVQAALTYPAFLIFAMIGIGSAIMLYVMPKLLPLFEGFGAQLPLATRILINVSRFISTYLAILLLILLIFSLGAIKLARSKLRSQWHALLLRLPLFGGLIKKVNLARFSRTLSTLLSTDILVVDALKITASVVGTVHYRAATLGAAEQIQKGVAIALTLKEQPQLFPATIITMIQVGEESGTLVDLLEEVAEFYEESIDETTKAISSLIEPALIIILGLAVGGMALAILMPMYALMQQV